MNEFKKEIIDICRYLIEKNYIGVFDGNISYRVDERKILITPKRKNKYKLVEDDLVVIDYNGKKLEGRNEPSGEWQLHCMIYNIRKDINAVIHTHPIFSTAFSVAGVSFKIPILVETVSFLDKIKEIDCVPFYSKELVEIVKKYVNNFDIFLLRNHGLVSLGKNLDEAVFLTEKVEGLAKVVFIVKILNKKIKNIAKREIIKIKNLIKEAT